jgi:hypothetical protein
VIHADIYGSIDLIIVDVHETKIEHVESQKKGRLVVKYIYSFCQITWNISSRCIVRFPGTVNIIKVKGSVGRLLGRK